MEIDNIYNMDCLEGMKQIPDGSIDAVICDLPYGVLNEKADEQTYIDLLENYIKHGTIYTQAKSFRKEQVVSVRYGENGAVEVELVNGTTIIPKSNAVTNLIKTIFGHRLDTWSYSDVKEPTDNFDKIETPNR